MLAIPRLNNPGTISFIACKIAINVVIYSYYHTKFRKSQHAKIACLTGLTLHVECVILFMLGNRDNGERFIMTIFDEMVDFIERKSFAKEN